jgi:hypothetical protein
LKMDSACFYETLAIYTLRNVPDYQRLNLFLCTNCFCNGSQLWTLLFTLRCCQYEYIKYTEEWWIGVVLCVCRLYHIFLRTYRHHKNCYFALWWPVKFEI